jgi:hypothetical protein
MNKGKLKNKELLNEYGYEKVPLKQILQLGLSIQEQQLLLTMFCLIENGEYQPRITGLNIAKHYSQFTSIKNCKSKSSRMLGILNSLVVKGYIIIENNDYMVNLEKIYFEGNKSKDMIYNKVLNSEDSIETDVPKAEYLDDNLVPKAEYPIVPKAEYPIVPKAEYPGTQSCVPKVLKLDEKGTQSCVPIHTSKQIKTDNKTDSIQKCKFFDFDFEISQDKELLKIFNNETYLNNLKGIISNIENGRYVNLNYVINKRYPSVDKNKENPINNYTKLKEMVLNLSVLEYKNSDYMFDIRNEYVQDIYSKVYVNYKKDDKQSKFIKDYFQLSLAIISEYVKFNSDDILANLLYLTIKHQCVNYSIYGNAFNTYLEHQINKYLSKELEVGSTDNIKKDIKTKTPSISEG